MTESSGYHVLDDFPSLILRRFLRLVAPSLRIETRPSVFLFEESENVIKVLPSNLNP